MCAKRFVRRLVLAFLAIPVCAAAGSAEIRIAIHWGPTGAEYGGQAFYDPMALSPTGKWLAVVERQPMEDCALNVYDLRTRKVVAVSHSPSIIQTSWHPWKPLIAAPCDLGWNGEVFRLLKVRTNKIEWFNPDSGGPADAMPVAWMPDGLGVVTARGMYVSRRKGVWHDIPGLWTKGLAGSLTVATDWTIAIEWETPNGPWPMQIYRKTTGKLRYHLAATLRPGKNAAGDFTDFRTQPGFLASGRLGYARVFLNARGERVRVELWTCRADGKDERKWLRLPLMPKETSNPNRNPRNPDPDDYRLAPVSWTRDGRTIAYVYAGAVHVKRVRPPR